MDLRLVLLECLTVNELTSNDNVRSVALEVYDLVSNDIEQNLNERPSQKQINEVQKKLKLLLYHYRKLIEERNDFFANFPKWREVRCENIKKLREIADCINYHRFNCNISKTVGTVTGIVGGILCVASAVMIPFTLGATTPLAIAGGSMSGAGGATTFGASVAEVSLEAKNMTAAQSLLDEDKQKFQDAMSWYKQSKELETIMDSIIGFNVMQELMKQAREFFDCFREVHDAILSDKFLSLARAFIRILSKHSPAYIGFLPLIISIIVATVMIDKKNRFMVDTVLFLKRSTVLVTIFLDIFSDGVMCALQGVKGVSPAMLKAAARGGLAVVGIGLDVASLVLTSIDIHKGSISENAENLKKCAKAMGEELKQFQSIYDELIKKQILKECAKAMKEDLKEFQSTYDELMKERKISK